MFHEDWFLTLDPFPHIFAMSLGDTDNRFCVLSPYYAVDTDGETALWLSPHHKPGRWL